MDDPDVIYVDFSSPDANRERKGGARAAPPDDVREQQVEFEFAPAGEETGHARWLAAREAAIKAAAQKLNLPLGRQVELWLSGGIRLRGKLRLQNEPLIVDDGNLNEMPLEVDGTVFPFSEIESCVRLD